MDPQLGEVFQLSVEHIYDNFLNVVSQSRNLSVEEVDKVAQGRVWIATQAQQFGLVDNLGTMQDAIDAAAQKASLDFYEVITIEQELSAKEKLIAEIVNNAAVKTFTNSEWLSGSSNHYLTRLVSQLQDEIKLLSSLNDPQNVYAICEQCQVKM